MIKKWTKIKSEDVSPSKWFPIVKDTVKLPNELILDDYYYSPLGNVAMILPITKDNEIIFVKQYKHGYGDILLELPAGFQKPNKSIQQSAIEELAEELGVIANIEDLIEISKVIINPTKLNHISYAFLVKNSEITSKQNLDSTEEIEIVKINAKKVIEMILNGEISVADSVSAILIAKEKFPELFN